MTASERPNGPPPINGAEQYLKLILEELRALRDEIAERPAGPKPTRKRTAKKRPTKK